jgi:hypothetical protein
VRNNGQSPVLGFTEAELGIALAVLAAVILGTGALSSEPGPVPPISRDSVELLVNRLDSLAKENSRQSDSLAAHQRRLRAQADSLKRMKSAIWPNCPPALPIFEVEVLGPNSYRLRGATVTIRDIEVRTVPQREAAVTKECRLIAGVRSVPSVSAPDYQTALNRLGTLGFRTRPLGSVVE